MRCMRPATWLSRALVGSIVMAGSILGTHAAQATISSQTRLEAGKQIKTHHITVDGLDFTPAESGYVGARLVGIEGYQGVHHRIGEPELPVVRFYAEGDIRVEATQMMALREFLPAHVRIRPAQPSWRKMPEPQPPFVVDESVYQQQNFVPAENFYTIEDAGSVRGVMQKLVTIYPLSYEPATSAYRLVRSFTVTATSDAPRAEPAVSTLAVVVGAKFSGSPSLAAYAALKESLGFRIAFVPVASGMTPLEIRAKLKELYQQSEAPLTHVLLVGDAEDVPAKPGTKISGITDHFYRSLDTDDYLSDINGPDVGLGRVAVSSESELATVLDKFTRYHKGSFGREDWLDGIAFIATDDRYRIAEGSHNYVIQTHTAERGYKGIFPSAEERGGDKLYAITHRVPNAKVHDVLRAGRTIINYSGHGSHTSWHAPNVEQSDVRSMVDPDALPFVVSNACITGDFRIAESFAETWQRHPSGAITFYGSMDSSYWDEDDILERRLFDKIFRDGELNFRKMTDYAQKEVWRYFGGAGRSQYYWETYHTFGDPTLELRTTRPRSIQVQGPLAVPVGSSELAYTVLDAAGSPLSGMRVALTSGEAELRMAAISDEHGRVQFDVTAATREVSQWQLAVAGANIKSYSQDFAVIPANEAYLNFSSFAPNGRTSLIAYPGESLSLGAKVTNLGRLGTLGGVVRLISVEGPATISGGDQRLPALASGETYQLDDSALALIVDEAASSGASLRVVMEWTTDEGQTAQMPLTLTVNRASLTVKSVDFGKQVEGGIRPGEEGDIWLTVTNSGTETIRDAELFAEAGTCVADVSGQLTVVELAPGESLRLPQALTVSIDEDCHNGDRVTMGLSGEYESHATTLALDSQLEFLAGVLITLSYEQKDLNLPIQDNQTITQAIEVPAVGAIEDLGVSLGFQHSFLSDLVIKLIHPDGTEVTLQSREGGSGGVVTRTWGLGGIRLDALLTLKGKQASGRWKISVQDTAPRDTGILNEVKLSLKGYLERDAVAVGSHKTR